MLSKLSRVTLFIITILLASCSDDFFSASSNGETTVTFTFYTTDEDNPSGKTTRAINSSNESTVNDITVFIFDSNGNNIGYGYSNSGTNIKIITRQASNCKVYAFANIRNVMGETALSGIATESQLKKKTHNLEVANNLTNDTYSLIMSGIITGFNTSTSTQNITLTRLAAKFTFNIKVPLGMDIASFQICSTPTGSQLISDNTKWSGSYGNLSTTTPTYANYEATTITFTKYLYENLAGNGSNSSISGMAGRTQTNAPANASYIDIKTHNYNNSSSYTTYRVYLGGPTLLNSGSTSGYNNYDIKRNTHYTVNIDLTKKAPNVVYNYDYTGAAQTFNVPIPGTYKIECWGAQGSNTGTYHYGGKGAYCSGNVNIPEVRTLYIYVGAQSGGFGGGGVSHEAQRIALYGNDGGGATDVRLNTSSDLRDFTSLKSRIIVAAGGGGANYRNNHHDPTWCWGEGDGGYGGALEGGNGIRQGVSGPAPYIIQSFGAKQNKGGYHIKYLIKDDNTYNTTGEVIYTHVGVFGYCKCFSDVATDLQSGGGGGYYGGSASAHCGGSGGSSFISGYQGCNAITQGSTASSITHTNQPNHYSDLVFTNTTMTAGNENMPTPSGKTEKGHSGNGYARITFISAN